MSLAMQVLAELAEARALEAGAPRFVSGAALARNFQVTRSAIWKAISQLRGLGAEIDATTHRGYRLALPSSPLDAGRIVAQLAPETRALLRGGGYLPEIDSTNSALLARGAPPPGQFDFLVAEYQGAGRGRRGRSWLAPPGGAVCLSWSWCFEGLAAAPGALSLAIGVAALRALGTLGIAGVRLKWPNDLVSARGKLGGILIETRAEVAGPAHVVAGLGLNVTLGTSLRARIGATGQAPSDLMDLTAADPPPRNAIVAALLDQGIAAMLAFGRAGFEPFRDDYRAADALSGRAVAISGGSGIAGGIARGVDPDGALRIEHGGTIHRIIAGEVSVRTNGT